MIVCDGADIGRDISFDHLKQHLFAQFFMFSPQTYCRVTAEIVEQFLWNSAVLALALI